MIQIFVAVLVTAVVTWVVLIHLNTETKIDGSNNQNTEQVVQKGGDTKGLIPAESDVAPVITASKMLSVSGQGLTIAPESIFTQTEIEELNLSNNLIEGSLQAEVRHLQNLRVLNLSDNNFTGVPAEVGQLQKLEVLNLSNNNLTGLPYELGNLSSLRVLNLKGNEYSVDDLEVIKEGLSSTVIVEVD